LGWQNFLPVFAANLAWWRIEGLKGAIALLDFSVILPKDTKTRPNFCQYNILFPKKFAWQKSA
jgi:hypothetical protein